MAAGPSIPLGFRALTTWMHMHPCPSSLEVWGRGALYALPPRMPAGFGAEPQLKLNFGAF